MEFPVHTIETAPEGAKETLKGMKQAAGFVPNLMGVMAQSPELVKAYLKVGELFDQTSFSPTERQVIFLTVNYENECTYCVAAHSAIAARQKIPADVVEALRSGTPIADEKLEALRLFTKEVVQTRGWPSGDALNQFAAAGYTRTQVLEVILGVGMKVLSNYTNHIAQTPLDEAFASAKWTKEA